MSAAQLRMLWPAGTRPAPAALALPTGYALRSATQHDVPAFLALTGTVELARWDDDSLRDCLDSLVPDGWHVAVHQPTGDLVATGMAQRKPIPDLYPDGYEVGWIAAHPRHSGHGLGRAVTAAATDRLVASGATTIYLQTDDHRLPAVKTYLALGFVPHLYQADMAARWQRVCEQLAWPYQPERWPAVS